MKQTFAQWLAAQRDRDDPVGDLARDVQHDPDFRGGSRQRLAHLERAGASLAALAALQRAEREWYETSAVGSAEAIIREAQMRSWTGR